MTAACMTTTLLGAVVALAVLLHTLYGLLTWMWALVREDVWPPERDRSVVAG